MASVLEQIRAWATELKPWEQLALEKVALGSELTELDYEDLLDACMQDAGLIERPTKAAAPLRFPRRAAIQVDEKRPKLRRLFDLHDVNALPEDQQLTFGDQVTLVYGGNGAGKTGYTRPLGCAAFGRGQREVLPDARDATTERVPSARFEIEVEGESKEISWEFGNDRPPELAGFYVFDGNSLPEHLTKSNLLAFSPRDLSLLTILAEVTDAVRDRLRALLAREDPPNSFGALFGGPSTVADKVTALAAATDLSDIEACARLTSEEEARISTLELEVAQLKSQTAAQRIGVLQQEATDLRRVVSQFGVAVEALDNNAETRAHSLRQNADACQRRAAEHSSEEFRFEPLKTVGTPPWRDFITSVMSLANLESSGRDEYPQPGDACLLCHQPLSAGAIDLIVRLREHLRSDAAAKYRAAEEAVTAEGRRLQSIDLNFFSPQSAARRLVEAEEAALAGDLGSAIQHLERRKAGLTNVLVNGAGEFPPPTNDAALVARLQILTQGRIREVARLQRDDPSNSLRTTEQELRELRHRSLLREHLEEVKRYVSKKRWIDLGWGSLGSTRHITTKYNELFQQLVTDEYTRTFQHILGRLKRDLNVALETRGHKGTTVRQVILNPEKFPAGFQVDRVLSDGEKRAVALADFLTEASLDPGCAGVVLDDPVSSLDRETKNSVSEYLAELSRQRQVVIFTHDLVFLSALAASCKKMSVATEHHWIRRENGNPGYVYLNNSPTCEEDYKSAKQARLLYKRAKDAPPEEQEHLLRHAFGALRTSYEAFVLYDLFNGVVTRHEDRIGFDRLRTVEIDRDVVAEVVDRMSALSRHIEGHLHDDGSAGEKPTPELLLQEIEAFETVRRKHKKAQAPDKSLDTTVGVPSEKPVAKAANAATETTASTADGANGSRIQ